MTPETEITRGGEWGGGGGGGVKRRTFCGVSVEIFWNNTFHVKSLMTKILTNFKATQAKSLKIVVANTVSKRWRILRSSGKSCTTFFIN